MLERIYARDESIRVYQDEQGRVYVGVTSAISLVKHLLGEEPDSYGPPAMAKVHAQEGTWCHEVCLDWLAWKVGWIPSFEPPKWDPKLHPNERIMRNVVADAQLGFAEFVDQYQVEPIAIEAEVLSPAWGLVGHVDLVCTLLWKGRRVKAIIDLKFVTKLLYTHQLQVRCYNKCRGLQDANLGLLYQGDRNTGLWTIQQVDLNTGQDDVAAVANAARLVAWSVQKGRS